ncbi:MAG: ABC transporter ATP-binding protein [Pseudomonadota bacterium]|nr:ABC transporter ATP-binding protein [Euryarchaeota archaeon]MEC8641790.1 ABC transporter ATP-binding protein [Pseudomonadota bacterium]|tara:strand:+ start:3508 stop:4227 length:720 start_codon:yes stop_codon:yes gene_type:complete
MSVLRLVNLNKSFGALVVADSVTMDVMRDEALGIIGPNGAGKSTLFNLIAGNISADSGSIEFNGADVTSTPTMQRTKAGIGRTFQIPQPFENMTVFENLLAAAAFGQDRPEAQLVDECAEILEKTGLLTQANLPAGKLSLLERKRLELSRALATRPKLLLLDEIAGGLTEAECQSLVGTIRDIHARGVTIVWIEHVLHALTSVVERLVVLDFGRIIASGAPNKVMMMDEVREIYLGMEA